MGFMASAVGQRLLAIFQVSLSKRCLTYTHLKSHAIGNLPHGDNVLWCLDQYALLIHISVYNLLILPSQIHHQIMRQLSISLTMMPCVQHYQIHGSMVLGIYYCKRYFPSKVMMWFNKICIWETNAVVVRKISLFQQPCY